MTAAPARRRSPRAAARHAAGRRQGRVQREAGRRPGAAPAPQLGNTRPTHFPPTKQCHTPIWHESSVSHIDHVAAIGTSNNNNNKKNENAPPYRSPNRTATRPPTWPTQLYINMPNADVSIYATLHTSPHRDVCDSTHTTTKAFQTSPVRRTCRSLPHVPFKDLEWPNVTTDVDALIEHVENRTCRNPSTSET